MGYQDIIREVASGTVWITINRPRVHNAVRERTLDELIAAVRQANAEPEVGSVVITGAGDRAFCAGGDFASMMHLDRESGHLWNNRMIDLAMTIRRLGKPVIAMVNGWCMGGGNEIQLMCDLTIASDRALFGQTGAKVGACPVVGATQYLPRLIGDKRAKEMIFLCDRYTAEESCRMGMINKVVPHDQLRAETERWCQKILTHSPQTIRYTKVSMNFESDLLYPSWIHGVEMLSAVWGSAESLEGMRAFAEKRQPDFSPWRSRAEHGVNVHKAWLKETQALEA
ncbi:MAG: enoyl-CoA hydratase/isomerase family protein [Chloroflexi bacterium]|nr:enoyl-CoA hydratase/isomerase family protein [Chloroflexota bacterium]